MLCRLLCYLCLHFSVMNDLAYVFVSRTFEILAIVLTLSKMGGLTRFLTRCKPPFLFIEMSCTEARIWQLLSNSFQCVLAFGIFGLWCSWLKCFPWF